MRWFAVRSAVRFRMRSCGGSGGWWPDGAGVRGGRRCPSAAAALRHLAVPPEGEGSAGRPPRVVRCGEVVPWWLTVAADQLVSRNPALLEREPTANASDDDLAVTLDDRRLGDIDARPTRVERRRGTRTRGRRCENEQHGRDQRKDAKRSRSPTIPEGPPHGQRQRISLPVKRLLCQQTSRR